jgi:plastocyanin
MRALSALLVTGAVLLMATAAACGGSGSTPTTPAGVVAGSIGATISLTANGAVPLEVRIEPTQRVRIVNNDTRPHQVNTNPHDFHTDCPANNTIVLNPGQQVDTANFNDVKVCGFHNHLLPDDQKFWGTIRVGTDSGDKGPVYSRGW